MELPKRYFDRKPMTMLEMLGCVLILTWFFGFWAEIFRNQFRPESVFRAFVHHLPIYFWYGVPFMPIFWSRELFGPAHYAFVMGGKKHVERKDPRQEYLAKGRAHWISMPLHGLPVPVDGPDVIRGAIVRVRNGGLIPKLLHLFIRRERYNRAFFPDRNIALSFESTVYSSSIKDGHDYGLEIGNMPIFYLLELLSGHGNVSRLFRAGTEGWADFNALGRSVCAIRSWLTTDRRNRIKGSTVGAHLFSLLNTALDGVHGTEPALWKTASGDALTQLEAAAPAVEAKLRRLTATKERPATDLTVSV